MYPEALPVIEKKLKRGGVRIADNLFMGGGIFNVTSTRGVKGMRKFTRMVSKGRRWASTIVPLRDGVLVAYKV